MSNMKSEFRNRALEAALRMKATKVADLEAAIREFEGMASALDRQIKAEEDRTRIRNPAHFAYSNFAKSAIQRRDNLRASAASLKVRLQEACASATRR
jgi:flagellar FliJ protein